MLNPFGNKARLIRTVEELCILNDKGWGIAPNDPEALDRSRNKALAKITSLIKAVGELELPSDFLLAVKTGEIREELEGVYLNQLNVHFKRRKING